MLSVCMTTNALKKSQDTEYVSAAYKKALC